MGSRMLGAFGLALAACSTPRVGEVPDGATASAPLGMVDVSFLVPLPAALAAPVVTTIAGSDPESPLVSRGIVSVLSSGIRPKNGDEVAFEDFHLVAARVDLCDPLRPDACGPGDDGSLRLVFQPLLLDDDDEVLAHDIAIHALYRVPNADLPAVVAALRAMARLVASDGSGPLRVSPWLDDAASRAAYADALAELIATWATREHLDRITIAGQEATSAAFAWIFRGLERDGSSAVPMPIPGVGGATRQVVQLTGGDTVYNLRPLADQPGGFALAINGLDFERASDDERAAAIRAMIAIDDPRRTDASNLQCAACHVSTFLLGRRSAALGLDPDALPDRFTSARDVAVESLADEDARVVRAFGWAGRHPAISRRVAHETALVLDAIEARYPDL